MPCRDKYFAYLANKIDSRVVIPFHFIHVLHFSIVHVNNGTIRDESVYIEVLSVVLLL